MKAPTPSSLDIVRISTAGSVDDGKSTLLGRLLYETKSIFEDQYEALKRSVGDGEVDLALLTDGLRAEREQGITIDVAYRYFATPRRRFIVADTPGHRQYTRNMITGASNADVAIVLIDARNGLTDQSKRHTFIASLLRIPNLLVVVNKMDLVGFDEGVFSAIKEKYLDYASKLSLPNPNFVPTSALLGDNIVEASANMPWHRGLTVLEFLEGVIPGSQQNPPELRLPVQYVIRPNQDFRGYMGQVASGSIRVEDELLVLPSRQHAIVRELWDLDGPVKEAAAGTNVLLTLDREVDVSRGDMLVRPRNAPAASQRFEAVLCWMAEAGSVLGKHYLIRHTTREISASIESVIYRFDVETLHRDSGHSLALNDIGRVVIDTGRPAFFDTFEHSRKLGGFVMLDPVSNEVVAAGMVTRTTSTDEEMPPRPARVIWMTGLSGAGKSTISDALVERLKLEGVQAARLDGDDLRLGLNSDLGFTPEDRSENLRRAAHVAGLYASLGNLVVCSFITPLNSDRQHIREILGAGYLEVYVRTSLSECEKRDPKGLYKRARSGQLRQFTGITAPFEEPDQAELVLNTEQLTVEEAVEQVVEFLRALEEGNGS